MTENNMPALSTKRVLVLVGIVLLLFIGGYYWVSRSSGLGVPAQSNATPTSATVDESATPSAGGGTEKPGDKYSIRIELSEGQSQLPVAEALPLATGEPLSSEEIGLILARLPALPASADEQVSFNLPQEILPPPRPGETIEESFPPLERGPSPETVGSEPLHVLRFAPEGEIPVAPFVSVTFDQPMVPLGTLSNMAASAVPVQIEPSMPGTWRWLGTKTLTFEYDSELIDRLPKATEYRVTVPAGTKSAGGGVLADSVTWTFKTPPPKVVTTYPDNSPQPLEPIFFLAFDQRIDPQAVLKTIQVTAGSRSIAVVVAGQTDIDKDERVSQLVKNASEGRWLAFRAVESFPPETSISIQIGPGTPSAEGPLTTAEPQSFGFSTYAPLRIEEHRCAWYDDRCPPLTPFYIRFNNPLDADVFSEDLLNIQPEIPGLSINLYGNSIEIQGETQGQTTYTATVSGKMQDVFGQQLGRDARLTFRVGKAEPVLVGPGQMLLTLDPAASTPVFSVYAINYARLSLKIYSVQPSDWPKFKQALRDWNRTDAAPGFPGRLVEDKSLDLRIPTDALSQVDIDLSRYTSGGFGQFIIFVQPPAEFFETQDDKYRRYSQTIMSWVQITHIGLDAYNDHSEMVAWTTDLRDGSPLPGVSIQPDKGGTARLTGVDGVVRFDIPSGATYLTARKGGDQAILPRSNYYWGDEAWSPSPPSDSLSWYVFDDRQMYRPGEDIHIKGWLRRIGGRQNGDVGLVGSGVSSMSYQIVDPQGNALGAGRVDVNNLGGFDFVFSVPPATNLGFAQLYLNAEGDLGGLSGNRFYHEFQIQEFRRPEFEVTARNETTGPYFAGDHAALAVEAKYYAGGGLPAADVTWQVTTSPGSYSPPNWPDFTFGNWHPWWDFYEVDYPPPPYEIGRASCRERV